MEALLIHYLGNQRASLILIIQTALPCVSHTVSHASRLRLDCVLNASRMCIITETRPIHNTEYNYYSLGIVLLEIGLWSRIKEMTSKWKIPSARVFQQDLLARLVPNLVTYMATAYREAFMVCIARDCGLDESASGDSEVKSTLHLRFEEMVVSRLRGPWEAA
jgi:hypothetical protein